MAEGEGGRARGQGDGGVEVGVDVGADVGVDVANEGGDAEAGSGRKAREVTSREKTSPGRTCSGRVLLNIPLLSTLGPKLDGAGGPSVEVDVDRTIDEGPRAQERLLDLPEAHNKKQSRMISDTVHLFVFSVSSNAHDETLRLEQSDHLVYRHD
ncbi:hypothetical protein FRC09_007666 [Ceratobasidium sp. 395]|nr:hypothetical protein FRC09_007666 [Ceratobasidium sp. 395]